MFTYQLHLSLENVLPYKGVTFSEYNEKASFFCQKKMNHDILSERQKKVGRQTEGHINRQTERQKIKEREREKRHTFSKLVSFSLIDTLIFLPFIEILEIL